MLLPVLVQDNHEQGEGPIELLLDRERPGHEKGIQLHIGVKVAAVKVEVYICGRKGSGHGAFSQMPRFNRGEEDQSHDEAKEEDDKQRRKNPLKASLIEPSNGEPSLLHFSLDDRTDQVAGDDKEDINAYKPTAEP
jgi:hypothetical protein